MNLFNAAKTAFGYHFPNYDVLPLSERICQRHGWELQEVRFYTGLPDAQRDPRRHAFWTSKLSAMGRQGIVTFQRALRYDAEPPHQAHEKGINVRLALDVVRLARQGAYDVAIIFSQDQDLSEAVLEVYDIAREQRRYITVASAFPPNGKRGINRTRHLLLDRDLYDSCIDPHDYRPKMPFSPLLLPEATSPFACPRLHLS